MTQQTASAKRKVPNKPKVSTEDKVANAIEALVLAVEKKQEVQESAKRRMEELQREMAQLTSTPVPEEVQRDITEANASLIAALKQAEHGKVFGRLIDNEFHAVWLDEQGRLGAQTYKVDKVL